MSDIVISRLYHRINTPRTARRRSPITLGKGIGSRHSATQAIMGNAARSYAAKVRAPKPTNPGIVARAFGAVRSMFARKTA